MPMDDLCSRILLKLSVLFMPVLGAKHASKQASKQAGNQSSSFDIGNAVVQIHFIDLFPLAIYPQHLALRFRVETVFAFEMSTSGWWSLLERVYTWLGTILQTTYEAPTNRFPNLVEANALGNESLF